jgi:type II secretory pathway component GspD/PulD (secretin)
LATFTTAWLVTAADDPTNAPPDTTNAPPDATNAPPDATTPDQPATPPDRPATPLSTTPANTEPAPTNGLVLNFHDVPLNAVLTYLSAKAGIIVVSDVNLQGKVSVVAEQPISTNDIVTLLNDQLGKNGYAAILQGRTLTVMDAERAKTYALTPIKVPNTYTNLLMDDEIVTAILPLHTLSAPQLIKDLEPLKPSGATLTANEAGNAIIMTAQQKDIRRIDEIINDLDGSAVSEVNVTVLRFADAKSVAAELKEIFQTADSDITRANTRNNFSRAGGRGGFNPMNMFGGGGGGGGGGGNNDDASKNVSTKAVFVSDDQLNAVISSAPPDYMRDIINVITNLDQPSQDITEMHVFHLHHADPGEIADEITAMFPSTTANTDQNNRTMGFRFGGGFGGFGQQSANNQSQRMKRELTVTAVPDRRIQAVIVTASQDMMKQIRGVIEDLDQGTQGVQRVTALDFGGADPATVEQTLTGLFASANAKAPTSTQTATAIGNRYTGAANAQTSAMQTLSTSTGTTGSTGVH